MNIRIMSPQLGLNPDSTLGGEVYDYEILRGLAKRGVAVEIILPALRPHGPTVKHWHITRLPLTHIPSWLYNLIELPYLFSIYNKRPFHLLRLHVPYFTGIGAWVFKLFHLQVKTIATYHQARSGFVFDLFNYIFAKTWDGIITDNQTAKDKLIKKFGISSSKITVIHGGAPTYLKPIRKPHSGIVLLFMGLLIPRKNPLFLIQVVNQLAKKYPQLQLIICGDGPLKSAVKQTRHIKLYPPVHGPAKQKLYSQADIFVHPAIHEGFPLVVIEAMAAGLPVVISDSSWSREAIQPGINGELALINQVDDWVSKISLVIKNKSKYMIKNKFTWDESAKKHLQLCQKLLS